MILPSLNPITSTPLNLLDSLIELRSQVENSEHVTDETLQQLRDLDNQIHAMMQSNELNAETRLTDSLLDLETNFAAEHPKLEKIIREMVERLSQMGI